MGRNRTTFVLAAAVIALCVTQGLLFVRVQRLQEQLSARTPESARPVAAKDDSAPRDEVRIPARQETSVPPGAPAAGPATAGIKAAPAPVLPPDSPVNAGQVEEIVRRLLKEREDKHPIARMLDFDFEDPLVVMERELKLNPAQKLRIQDHMKVRDAAYDEIMKSNVWKEDPKSHADKWQAVHQNYEAAVKSELDYTQQQKYDEISKSGKLVDWGGSTTGDHVFIGGFKKAEEKK